MNNPKLTARRDELANGYFKVTPEGADSFGKMSYSADSVRALEHNRTCRSAFEAGFDAAIREMGDAIESAQRERDEALAQCEKLAGALELAKNRDLDWDLMHTKSSMELLQIWRGICFNALEAFRAWQKGREK